LKLFLLTLFVGTQLFSDIKVGIKQSEPWVIFDENSTEQRGFSIDLWNEISHRLDKKTEFVVFHNTSEIIEATKNGEIDAGITSITITSEREKEIDFSHSMYELGLQMMVLAEKTSFSPLDVFSEVFEEHFSWSGFLYFFIILLFITILRWLIDRYSTEKDEKLFSQHFFIGTYDAFLWAITMLVTFETPKSRSWARIIDLSWHITGLLILSITTALVTASITAKTITGSIKSEKDLIGKYVATVEGTAPMDYLKQLGAKTVPVETLDQGIKLVESGKVEVLVYDGPQLVYLKNQFNHKIHKKILEVLPITFNSQSYGIAFPKDSDLKEEVNQILLQLREKNGFEESFHDKLKKKWMSNL
jgi:polar amino acid transport system substrate-binding protein